MKTPQFYSPRNVAMDYLSRRDHSKAELLRKLSIKGFESEKISQALDKLEQENLLNDQRFAQGFIRYRARKGVGPIKIRHELTQKGVATGVIKQAEMEQENDWMQCLKQVAENKYGSELNISLKEKQKRTRFLLQRGFVLQDIMRLFA